MSKVGIITVYACGGAGINIVSQLEQYRRTEPEPGFSLVCPVYVDTSASNFIEKNLPEDFTYKLGKTNSEDEVDGSGKVRKHNSSLIMNSVLEILHKFRPGDLSIVVCSTTGGSGSVIGPAIVSELLKRGDPVIVIAVTSLESRIEIENAVKTLKSFESISNLHKLPVPMMYYENTSERDRFTVNTDAEKAIHSLSALFSRQNKELDKSDLTNWLFYNKVTSFAPRLCIMDVFADKVTGVNPGSVISIATLSKEGGDATTGQKPEYRCAGYVCASNSDRINTETPLHFVMLDGAVNDVFKELSNTLEELDESVRARISSNSILSKTDTATDNGLVF